MKITIAEQAESFARQRHANLFRPNKAKQPKIIHLAEVVALARKIGASENAIAAAWLHDVVEDTPTSLQEIEDLFGKDVAILVDGLTDPPDYSSKPLVDRKALQAERLRQKSDEVLIIKLCDQISNVRSVYDDPPLDWDAPKSLDYILGARKIADACKGKSAFLDNEFALTFSSAKAKYK